MVRHLGMRRIDAMETSLSQPQAKIDIIEGDRQCLVHAIHSKVS